MDSNHACLPIVQEDLGWWWWWRLLISPDISNWKKKILTLNWYLGRSMEVLPKDNVNFDPILDRCHHFAFSRKQAVNRDTRNACKWRRRISGTWRDIRSYCRSVGRVTEIIQEPQIAVFACSQWQKCAVPNLISLEDSYIFATKTTSTNE
jgi:hypothetical protein